MKNILEPGIWYLLTVLSLVGCSTKLQVAAERGNVQSVIELLDEGESISETDYRGWTALHYAARVGQKEVVNLLIAKGADIEVRIEMGETPMHLAAGFCHEGAVQALLENGANVSPTATYDRGGHFYLMTPLLMASGAGCNTNNIVTLLLNAGVNINEVELKSGYNALIFGATSGTLETVKALVSAGVDLNHQAKNGITALISASAHNRVEIVRFLLDQGAERSAIVGPDISGLLAKGGLLEVWDTALSAAKRRGNRDVVILLERQEK